jgi:hypothetical protein
VEKVSEASSFTVCWPGTVLTGASLMGRTSMVTGSKSCWTPPMPVLPRSLVVTLRVSVPLKSASGA